MGAGGDAGQGNGGTETVPWSRFQEVVDQKNQLRTELEQARQQAQQHAERAATADTLASQLEQMRVDLAARTSAWDEERGLMRAGITDPDAIEVVRLFHAKLPEDKRPSVGDWLAELKNSPDQAPATLRAVVPDLFGAGGDAGAKGDQAGGPRGVESRGVGSTRKGVNPGATQRADEPLSAERIKQIREECVRTGNWEPWQKIRASAYGG